MFGNLIKYDAIPSDYQTQSLLGIGISGMATVHLAKHLPSNTYIAQKEYNLDKLSREYTDLVQEEIILMRQLNHPCLLPSYCSYVTESRVMSILPLMAYGSTSDLLVKHFPSGLPEQIVGPIIKAVLLALKYLHSKGIIHRAIRGSHILVSSEGNVRLAGLRYSCRLISFERWHKKVHSFPFTTAPNLNWLSPELLQQNLQGYNEKSDVYSIGITACELANGIVPYWEDCKTLMLTQKVKGIQPQLIDASTFIPTGPGENEGEHCELEDQLSKEVMARRFSEAFHSLTELCLERDPEDRPSPKTLLNHTFIKSVISPSAFAQLLAMNIKDEHSLGSSHDENLMYACDKVSQLSIGSSSIETIKWDF